MTIRNLNDSKTTPPTDLCASLRAHGEALMDQGASLPMGIGHAASMADDAANKIERLRAALEWYAEPVMTYALTQVAEPRSAVHADGGNRARKALSE